MRSVERIVELRLQLKADSLCNRYALLRGDIPLVDPGGAQVGGPGGESTQSERLQRNELGWIEILVDSIGIFVGPAQALGAGKGQRGAGIEGRDPVDLPVRYKALYH